MKKSPPGREQLVAAMVAAALPPALDILGRKVDAYHAAAAAPYISQPSFEGWCVDAGLDDGMTTLLVVAYDARYPVDVLRPTHGLNVGDLRYVLHDPATVEAVADLARQRPQDLL